MPDEAGDTLYDLYRRGTSLLEAGDFAPATVPLSKAARMAPEKSSIREALGRAYFHCRRYAEAAQIYEQLLQQNPTDGGLQTLVPFEPYEAQPGVGWSAAAPGLSYQTPEETPLVVSVSPREIQHDNPEMRHIDEFVHFLGQIYNREVTEDDTVTVIHFSEIRAGG